MRTAWVRISTTRAYRVALLAILFFELLFARRSQQLINPQVWDEEGIFIKEVITEGLRSFLNPINGYLCSLPRLITFVSLPISFTHYPLVATILGWAIMVAVMIAVATAPAILRGGALLSIVVLLVPSDPEVLGISLYTLWFAALLMFVVALWRPDGSGVGWRAFYVSLSGLSSPAVVLAMPLFLVRCLVVRRRSEFIVAGIAAACAAIQVFLLEKYPLAGGSAGSTSVAHLGSVVPKFFGSYLVGNLGFASNLFMTIAGIGTLLFVAVAIWLDRRNASLYMLCYFWFGAIALTGARVDVQTLHPVTAGPRYFFLPYVFEGWLLIQIAATAGARPMRFIAAAMLLTALANALPVLNRGHIDLRWSEHVASCARTPDSGLSQIPVEFDGKSGPQFSLFLTGDQCRKAIRDSLLH